MASPQPHGSSNSDSFNNFHSKLYAAYIKLFQLSYILQQNETLTLDAKNIFVCIIGYKNIYIQKYTSVLKVGMPCASRSFFSKGGRASPKIPLNDVINCIS